MNFNNLDIKRIFEKLQLQNTIFQEYRYLLVCYDFICQYRNWWFYDPKCQNSDQWIFFCFRFWAAEPLRCFHTIIYLDLSGHVIHIQSHTTHTHTHTQNTHPNTHTDTQKIKYENKQINIGIIFGKIYWKKVLVVNP